MKVTKKAVIFGMAALMAACSLIPPTYSWYTHKQNTNGDSIHYERADLPVSVKSAAGVLESKTYECDVKGVVAENASEVTSVRVDAQSDGKAVKYYKTTFTNNGANDLYVDFEAGGLKNNADYYIGTTSPTVNEKAFASRAARTKKSNATTRVYFRTTNSFNPFWTNYIGDDVTAAYDSTLTNDFNIAYRLSGANEDTYAKLKRCDGTAYDSNNAEATVFYYDVPSNAEYFFFFNHYYIVSDSNKEWNSTINITDLTQGKLYYLTGGKVDEKWKEYKTESIDTDLVALNQYYDSVRMSEGSGVFADISLKKTSTDEDFIPEYYGATITYTSSNTSVASVTRDGIISPGTAGTAVITTKITGKYGDSVSVETTVSIPEKIDQIPIMKNIKVPADGSKDENGKDISNTVDIYWYALNKSTETGDNHRMTVDTLMTSI